MDRRVQIEAVERGGRGPAHHVAAVNREDHFKDRVRAEQLKDGQSSGNARFGGRSPKLFACSGVAALFSCRALHLAYHLSEESLERAGGQPLALWCD